MPKRIAVTVVKIKNFSTGICEICAHRLTTSAVEQPMISRPPMISPQRMLLSSMKELSTSLNGRGGGGGSSGRGGGAARGGGGGGATGSLTGNGADGTDGGGAATGSTRCGCSGLTIGAPP